MEGARTSDSSLNATGTPVANAQPIFRPACITGQQNLLAGRPVVIAPPSVPATLLTALISVALLAAAVLLVEVPVRTTGVGLLMPPSGLLRVAATTPGRVSDLYVVEGQRVTTSQSLLRIASDNSNLRDGQLSDLQLASLRRELDELGKVNRARLANNDSRLRTLALQSVLTEESLVLAQTELDHQRLRSRITEDRGRRLNALAAGGNISLDQYQQHELESLQTKISLSVVRQRIKSQEVKLQDLHRQQELAKNDKSALNANYDIERERLFRAIDDAEASSGRTIPSPESAVVARLAIKRGATFNAGQTLVTLIRPGQELQAWVYVSSARASGLRNGQALEIQMDAYPYQEFGLLAATIESVSKTSLLPAEIDVPIGLRGPVYEIRASINLESLRESGLTGRLRPGLTFRADLIHQRYRLYEWLFHTMFRRERTGVDASIA